MLPLPPAPKGDVGELDESARRLKSLQKEVFDLMLHASQRLDVRKPKLGDIKPKVEERVSAAGDAVSIALQQIDGVLAAIVVERMRVQSALDQWETTCRRIREQEQQR